jgi:hypothetical protein
MITIGIGRKSCPDHLRSGNPLQRKSPHDLKHPRKIYLTLLMVTPGQSTDSDFNLSLSFPFPDESQSVTERLAAANELAEATVR